MPVVSKLKDIYLLRGGVISWIGPIKNIVKCLKTEKIPGHGNTYERVSITFAAVNAVHLQNQIATLVFAGFLLATRAVCFFLPTRVALCFLPAFL